MELNTIIQGDCLEVMRGMEDNCVDLVLTDPPYGTTACKWDSIIPLEPMWEQLKRVIKPNGAIVMTASQPFTTTLIASNMKMFKYEWIWQKAVGSNFACLKYQPMKEHENVLVFGCGTVQYYPIMQDRLGTQKGVAPDYTTTKSANAGVDVYGEISSNRDGKQYGTKRNPPSIQYFNNRIHSDRGKHPTQKPVALMKYMIKTYSNEGEIVLDFTCGSGTTLVAAELMGRNYIGIEISPEYCEIARKRVQEAKDSMGLFKSNS